MRGYVRKSVLSEEVRQGASIVRNEDVGKGAVLSEGLCQEVGTE